jgi:nitrate reductase NapAB chaperone NapD
VFQIQSVDTNGNYVLCCIRVFVQAASEEISEVRDKLYKLSKISIYLHKAKLKSFERC